MRFPSDDFGPLIDGGDYAEQSFMRMEERDRLATLVTTYFAARAAWGAQKAGTPQGMAASAELHLAEVALLDAVGLVPVGASIRDDGLTTPITGREVRKPDRRIAKRRVGDHTKRPR